MKSSQSVIQDYLVSEHPSTAYNQWVAPTTVSRILHGGPVRCPGPWSTRRRVSLRCGRWRRCVGSGLVSCSRSFSGISVYAGQSLICNIAGPRSYPRTRRCWRRRLRAPFSALVLLAIRWSLAARRRHRWLVLWLSRRTYGRTSSSWWLSCAIRWIGSWRRFFLRFGWMFSWTKSCC